MRVCVHVCLCLKDNDRKTGRECVCALPHHVLSSGISKLLLTVQPNVIYMRLGLHNKCMPHYLYIQMRGFEITYSPYNICDKEHTPAAVFWLYWRVSCQGSIIFLIRLTSAYSIGTDSNYFFLQTIKGLCWGCLGSGFVVSMESHTTLAFILEWILC